MEVIRAEAMGMCFGVRDALKLAGRVAEPDGVTIYGELVHNEEVTSDLARRGFRSTPESARGAIPESPTVLITAHGISHRERDRLATAGTRLLDTTCPLVRHVHEAAVGLARAGYFVVVLGRRGHVEVEGITGDLDRFAVVQGVDDVEAYPGPRLGVVCQSTTPPDDARRLLEAIEAKNPGKDVRFVDTICRPTRDRQEAVNDLIGRVDALVVVGGSNSNNTRQLARLAESRGLPVVRVQSAADLDPAWFTPYALWA
jgi:4-hydroxy-3-methylbut-2-enyl diphosphate reductase